MNASTTKLISKIRDINTTEYSVKIMKYQYDNITQKRQEYQQLLNEVRNIKYDKFQAYC